MIKAQLNTKEQSEQLKWCPQEGIIDRPTEQVSFIVDAHCLAKFQCSIFDISQENPNFS